MTFGVWSSQGLVNLRQPRANIWQFPSSLAFIGPNYLIFDKSFDRCTDLEVQMLHAGQIMPGITQHRPTPVDTRTFSPAAKMSQLSVWNLSIHCQQRQCYGRVQTYPMSLGRPPAIPRGAPWFACIICFTCSWSVEKVPDRHPGSSTSTGGDLGTGI